MTIRNIKIRNLNKLYYEALNYAIIESKLDCFKQDIKIAVTNDYPLDYSPKSGAYTGMTLLMCSLYTYNIFNPDISFAKMLLDLGADVNIKDKDGRPALFYASHYFCTPEVYKIIIAKTKDIKEVWEYDGDKNNALDVLFQRYVYSSNDKDMIEARELIKLLLDNGYAHEDIENAYKKLPNAPSRSGYNIASKAKKILVFALQHLENKEAQNELLPTGYDYEL